MTAAPGSCSGKAVEAKRKASTAGLRGTSGGLMPTNAVALARITPSTHASSVQVPFGMLRAFGVASRSETMAKFPAVQEYEDDRLSCWTPFRYQRSWTAAP